MRVVCAKLGGIVLHSGMGADAVTLTTGVNDIDDAFGEAWFTANAASPLITDGLVIRYVEPVVEPEPVTTTEEPV